MTNVPTPENPLRIAMWSGPRNISTAMMRAFGNRSDTAVWDEPLYGYYLSATGLDHPGAAEIIEAGGRRWEDVVAKAIGNVPNDNAVWYQKHMAQHFLDEVDRGWLSEVKNCFLIREPLRVVASYRIKQPNVTVAGLGFVQQTEIFNRVCDAAGEAPIVIDSKEMLLNPAVGMKMLCEALGIEFSEKMLAWPAGAHQDDGVWSKHWYDAVEKSTGFAPYVEKPVSVPDELLPIVEACQPHFDLLYKHRMRIPEV